MPGKEGFLLKGSSSTCNPCTPVQMERMSPIYLEAKKKKYPKGASPVFICHLPFPGQGVARWSDTGVINTRNREAL